ncbi:MAG: c-type cytochrome [Flavobacteriia bacterium]|jgi:cytochrome c oxidase cbb3-type subunit 3
MKSLQKILIAIAIFCLGQNVIAQGEQLFKAKCNTCHLLEKNSTGPNLKGVKQKWTDAGEAEMLYDWVKGSGGLIATGKSKMANEIKGFSATEMPPQAVSNEEVDAILGFVDSYVAAPEPTKTDVTNGETATNIKYVPNYKDNLDIFYWLLIGIFIELVAILIISNSIITLVKSDYFQKRLAAKKDKGTIVKAIVVILTFGLIASQNTSYALQFTSPGESKEPTLWLLVENTDLYFLIAINVILVGVIIYLRGMFKNFLNMVKTEKEKAVETPALKKINHILTDVVPIEEESKIMLHHEYDGIRELDNNLPPWWVWGFFATIIFAFVYIFNYHILGTSDLQIKAYEKDIQKSEREVKAYLSKMAMNVDETNATLLTESGDIASGKSLFQTNCVTCHKDKGQGDIGPNLTDKAWIYGYDIKEVFKTIKLGTANGMPEHNSKLNPVQIQQVASFVLQLKETAGKEAQGTIIEK